MAGPPRGKGSFISGLDSRDSQRHAQHSLSIAPQIEAKSNQAFVETMLLWNEIYWAMPSCSWELQKEKVIIEQPNIAANEGL